MGVVETLAESGEQPEEEFFSVDHYPNTARVLERQESAQILVGDPRADRKEVDLMFSHGYRTLLMVPVVQQGESLGIVEAMCEEERPWTRTEMNRARIIANQLASVIQAFFRVPNPDAGAAVSRSIRATCEARSAYAGRPLQPHHGVSPALESRHLPTAHLPARPSCASRTRSSPPIPSPSSLLSAPRTVSAAAACPNRWAT